MTAKPTCYNRLKDKEKRRAARCRAVQMVLEEGQQITVVADLYGVSRQAVYDWIKVSRNHDGDVPACTTGRKSQLSLQQKEQLCEMVEKGPRALGYDFDAWTLRQIAALIKDQFGIVYTSLGYLSDMLRNIGLSVQRPERRARERDEKQVEDFRKNELPKIQKKGR